MREPHSDLPGSRLERGGVGGRTGRGQRAPRLAALAGRVARTGGEGRGAPRQRRRGDLRRPDRVLRHARGRDRGHLARDREPLVGRAGTRGHERDGRGAGAPAAIGAARGRRLQRAARCALAGFTPGGTARGALGCARGPSASALSLEALPVDARGRDCGARRRRARLRAQRRGSVAARGGRGRGRSGRASHGGCAEPGRGPRQRAHARRRRRGRDQQGLLGRQPILVPRRATIVLVVWVALAVGNGLYFSFSVFLVPLVDEFHWSRGLTAGAQSISTIVQGLLAPVAGILVDRFGPRRVILTGAALLSGASLLGATIHSAWELYLYTGALGAAGLVGLGPVPMGVLISRWFSERRGRAVGVAFSGIGLAADRFGGPLAATVSYGCTAGGSLALLALESDQRAGWLVAYALLFGLGFGARGPIITVMASDLFGGRRLGVIYGALSLGNGFGGAIGPWFGGFVHDVMGSYRLVFLASVVFCALGSTCFWLAPRRAP